MGEGAGAGARWNEDTERGGGAKNVRKERKTEVRKLYRAILGAPQEVNAV